MPHMIAMQKMVVVSHTVCAHEWGPEKIADADAPFHGDGGVAEKTLLPRVVPTFVAPCQTVWA